MHERVPYIRTSNIVHTNSNGMYIDLRTTIFFLTETYNMDKSKLESLSLGEMIGHYDLKSSPQRSFYTCKLLSWGNFQLKETIKTHHTYFRLWQLMITFAYL